MLSDLHKIIEDYKAGRTELRETIKKVKPYYDQITNKALSIHQILGDKKVEFYLNTGKYIITFSPDNTVRSFPEPLIEINNSSGFLDQTANFEGKAKKAIDELLEWLEVKNSTPNELPGGSEGKKKLPRAFKYAVSVDDVGDGRPYLRKLLKYAYEDLKKHSSRKNHNKDTLRKGIDEQCTGYDTYKRIRLASDKIDTKYVAYKNPHYKVR